MQKTVSEPAQTLSVLEECDVLVIGGGPAGISAAIGSARVGKKTIVVERYGCLGGILTTSSMENPVWCRDEDAVMAGGIYKELDDRMVKAGLCQPAFSTHATGHTFDTEALKYIADDMISENGAVSILHCLGVMPLMEGNTLIGVVTESKSGRQAILARRVVDCTGDGDIAARAGAPCVLEKDHLAGGALVYSLRNVDTRRTVSSISHSRVDVDGTDVRSITAAEISSRKAIVEGIESMRKHSPGMENARLRNFAMGIGIRETRHIIGEYVLTNQDIREGHVFDDTIGVCPFCMDGPEGTLPAAMSRHFQAPFRIMVPTGVENLLAAGRCVSAQRRCTGVSGVVNFAMLTGQAAGIASALSIGGGVDSRHVDIPALQKELIRQGVRIRT